MIFLEKGKGKERERGRSIDVREMHRSVAPGLARLGTSPD